MPDPSPNAPPPPTGPSGLLAWGWVGTVLASAAVGTVGYVGFTVAQIVSMATVDDVSVAAVADPPPVSTYATRRASTHAASPLATPRSSPASSSTSSSGSSAVPSVVAADEPSPAAASGSPAPERSARPSRENRPGRTRASAPVRTAVASTPELTRKKRLEFKHALWADRQLAAMLRTTSPAVQWFGGASWVIPVADYRLTARFGESGSLWSSTHTGLDFAAPTGTPVRAASAGTVTSVGWAGAYGNKIEITHPDGSETWYAHLSRTDVRVGAQVGTGTVIGAVGATGNVTGSHLHFEMRTSGGSAVDPDGGLRQHGLSP